jgi:FemAB-related protein (PEP-CTERM system-associated)
MSAMTAVRPVYSDDATTVSHDPLTVRLLDANSVAKWDAFVMAAPAATFFHRAGWKQVIERAFGHRTHFLYAEAGGRIQGVLPLAEVKSRLFGHALCSLPFCVYGGLVTQSDTAASVLDGAAERLAAELSVGYLEYRSITASHPDWIQRNDLYVTFRREISSDEETNMKAIPRKQRAMVRKGIKAGLTSEIDSNVDRFFAVYADNVHRHGTPALPKRYFALLREVFGKDCEVLTVLNVDKHPISSVLSFYFRDEVLPYYAGDYPAARDLAANDFKYWELMRRASERGYGLFDYGRSKVGTGPFDFKRNWGFEPAPLRYEYKLVKATSLPENNPLNPKYRLFIAGWRRLPLPVANWLGPHIVKYLG